MSSFEALTITNARVFNLEQEIGTVEVGNSANLLLRKGNPLESVTAYDTIETIIIRGRAIDRDSLLLPD